ncbi:MAG: hypothetical protein HY958_08805 [Bacteroidia bacterium]|nr:hypothetical protein [Bacteroidia bacterium]
MILGDSLLIVQEIKIEGNETTKEKIILRELPFRPGDTINKREVAELVLSAQKNLLNTSLFNYVTIEPAINSNLISFSIKVEERWYLWPYPILEQADRNFSSWIENRDINKINYGAYFIKYNFRGRKEILKVKTRLGYREQYSIFYSNPYLDNEQHNGISLGFDYFRQKEIAYITYENKLLYFRSSDNYILHSINSSVNYFYRKYLYNTHNLIAGYCYHEVADTIVELNPNFFINKKNNLWYPFFYYTFSRDCRDSRVYPLKGYYFDMNLSREGTLFTDKSDINVWYAKSLLREYFSLMNRVYLGVEVKGKKTLAGYFPYFLNKALGYQDFLRGFEYYVIDGTDYFVSKANLKFELVAPRIKQFNSIPLPKFNKVHYAIYANLFFDYGYVNDETAISNNYMTNTSLYSGGVGIDFVTYYDKIFRIEFTINNFGLKGLYFHFGAPIFINN